MKETLWEVFTVILSAVIFLLLLGCSRGKEEVYMCSMADFRGVGIHMDSSYLSRKTNRSEFVESIDLTSIKDCVVVVVDTTGRVISQNRWHSRDRTRGRDRNYFDSDSTDKCSVSSNSSSVTKELLSENAITTERRISMWEKFKSDWFSVVLTVSIAAVAVLCLIIWKRKRV